MIERMHEIAVPIDAQEELGKMTWELELSNRASIRVTLKSPLLEAAQRPIYRS